MTEKRWIAVNYNKNLEIPRAGEVILLPLSLGNVDFPHGPGSHFTTSSQCSIPSSTSGNTPVKRGLRLVLVLSILHSRQNNKIRLSVLPIVSYSSPPRGRSTASWDPDQWISQEATDVQRLHHLPIPSTGWTPSLSSQSSYTPVLSFRNWSPTSPSWVAMVRVPHTMSEADKWYRHPDGPLILDGGSSSIMSLYTYLDNVIPSMLDDGTDSDDMVDEESITESELQQALLGNDGLDPISFWNFPGAPKELQEDAQQYEKVTLDEKISRWRNVAVAEGANEFDVESESESSSEASLGSISEGTDVEKVVSNEGAHKLDIPANVQTNFWSSQSYERRFSLPPSISVW